MYGCYPVPHDHNVEVVPEEEVHSRGLADFALLPDAGIRPDPGGHEDLLRGRSGGPSAF